MVEATATAEVIRKHQVQQNQCLELVIDMSKNSSECQTYSWWTDHAWHYVDWSNGTCPAPYTHVTRCTFGGGALIVDVCSSIEQTTLFQCGVSTSINSALQSSPLVRRWTTKR